MRDNKRRQRKRLIKKKLPKKQIEVLDVPMTPKEQKWNQMKQRQRERKQLQESKKYQMPLLGQIPTDEWEDTWDKVKKVKTFTKKNEDSSLQWFWKGLGF